MVRLVSLQDHANECYHLFCFILKSDGTAAVNYLIGQGWGDEKDIRINGQIAGYIGLFFLSVIKFHGWVNKHHGL